MGHLAARHGFSNIVKDLAERGISMRTPNLAGETPLHFACSSGQENEAEMLLEYEPDVDYATFKRACPLHDAAKKGHLPLVELLLDKGANINAVYKSSFFKKK